jgi:hypothetical protein
LNLRKSKCRFTFMAGESCRFFLYFYIFIEGLASNWKEKGKILISGN